MRSLWILAIMVVLTGCDRAPGHLAPIADGAIPNRVGCDVGCEELNKYERWQPYLLKAAEVHRRHKRCSVVEYVSIDTSNGTPERPVFFVMCGDKAGKQFNSFYTKEQVDAATPVSVKEVTKHEALNICDKELPRYFKGYFDGAVTRAGFHASEGRATVFYDLVIDGRERKGNCVVGNGLTEFTIVK